MAKSPITLPNGKSLNVFHTTDSRNTAKSYFNQKRLCNPPHSLEKLYLALMPMLVDEVVQEVKKSGVQFDALVSPPSSSNDAAPYRQAILNHFLITDLTSRFNRNNLLKAQNSKTTVHDLVTKEFAYKKQSDENTITSLLIVDDAMATGKTAAALIQMLQNAGMPSCAKVHIAVCSMM